MKIKTIKDADVTGKKVLLRVDFNVPLEGTTITDDTRMLAALPTIEHLIKNGAQIIVMTHLGRPGGKHDEHLELDPVAKHLANLINQPVKKVDDCIGKEVTSCLNEMKDGDIVLLENMRFHMGEESCEEGFCKELAELGDIFVVDSFGTAHRKHASTYGLAKHLPTYAGLLMEKEINELSVVTKETPSPFTLIMGGAKIQTKIGLMKNFIARADYMLVGGGLANTFLAAQGFDVGGSLYEEDQLDTAREIMLAAESLGEEFVLPHDAIVADKIEDDVPVADIPVEDVEGEMKILDIGSLSIKKFEEIIAQSKTVIWNGPVGLYEKDRFSRGTRHIAIAVSKCEGKTIVGGGDTIDAINHFGIDQTKFDHVSTGGAAMLQFLEGTLLPGVEVVLDSE